MPNRPWFKHQIYAPGFYTGYAAKTIPAVREAIEQKQWKQADEASSCRKVCSDRTTIVRCREIRSRSDIRTVRVVRKTTWNARVRA